MDEQLKQINWILGITITLFLGFVFVVAAVLASGNPERFSDETFHAWEHANPTLHLTKDEWDRLVRNNMLPAQNQYVAQ